MEKEKRINNKKRLAKGNQAKKVIAQNKKKIIISAVTILIIAMMVIVAIFQSTKLRNIQGATNPELARAMTYEQFEEGEDAIEGTDNVKFSSFFLRDVNNDGYAEKIKGTCKEIGKEDTLYMEINVQTAGYLKDAKIQINAQNFYLQTAIPKDEQLKNNYIGNNTKQIEFNQLNNGTQKLLTGIVRSGDYSYSSSIANAIGNDTKNYSKTNQIVLTGIYVDENGKETPITKTVDLEMDWYGTTKTSMYNLSQERDITNCIDEENQTVNLTFNINTEEIDKKLIISKSNIEGIIPQLNGYSPSSVALEGTNGKFTYDESTRKFQVEREASINDQGIVINSVSRSNGYTIKVVYPIEAYQSLGEDTIEIKIPVTSYYEGYNNSNSEFKNPYKSNIAKQTIIVTYKKPEGTVANFNVTVGKYVNDPTYRYMVSKKKPLTIYNGVVEEAKEDTYLVRWYGYTGTDGQSTGMVMKETKTGEAQVVDQFIKTDSSSQSMEEVTSNVGIYFGNPVGLLGEDGWIKVYDDTTGQLMETFTKENWSKYSESNPYRYTIPVKHVRIETSNTNAESSICVYHVKELDDEYITTNYTKEEFDNLQYIKSTLTGYIGENYITQTMHHAEYEAPYSHATIGISKNTISTQGTEENEKITIETKCNELANQERWQNGIFLVKMPTEIIDIQINDVKINNSSVNLESYELIEQDGERFIKIVTKNTTEQSYTITLDVDLSPDPRIATTTKQIELYATNENGSGEYYYSEQDRYDVNNNLNTKERVNKTSTSISLVSPNSLLTNQVATNYDDKGSMVISPQIADIKPTYAIVNQEQKEQTAQIEVQIKNNYGSTISEIQLLGKIPFKGNTYVISGKDLGSTFTTKMTNSGISLPAELEGVATVYYSEKENPDKEIAKEENGWKTAEQIENWDNIKTFLIDLGNYVMQRGKEFVFDYTVKIPNGLEFNQVAFSHHGIYFNLDTEQGKYKTQTEPNRLGFRIAEKYDLELTKYQTGRGKLVPGATYSIKEIIQDEEGEEIEGETKTGVTNSSRNF